MEKSSFQKIIPKVFDWAFKDFFLYFYNQPELMGDGKHLLKYGKDVMNVNPQNWIELQAIHGAVHSAQIGLK